MITNPLELFVISNVMFWITLALIFLFLTILTDSDWHVTKFLLVIGTILLFWPMLKSVNGTQLTISTVTYITVGILYSFLRWFLVIRDTIHTHQSFLRKYKISNFNDIDKVREIIGKEISAIRSTPQHGRNQEFQTTRIEMENDNDNLSKIENVVDPMNNKYKLLNWVFYWPWSVLKICTTDLSEAIYNMCKNQYKNIVSYLLKQNSNNPN